MPVTGKERVASAVPTFSEGPSTARWTGPLNVPPRRAPICTATRPISPSPVPMLRHRSTFPDSLASGNLGEEMRRLRTVGIGNRPWRFA